MSACLSHASCLFCTGLSELYVDERVLVPSARRVRRTRASTALSPWISGSGRSPHLGHRHRSGAIERWLRQRLPAGARGCNDYLRIAACRFAAQRSPLALSRARPCLAVGLFQPSSKRRLRIIIVSNPPYVGRAEMRTLPPEYRPSRNWAMDPASMAWIRCGQFLPTRELTSRTRASW